MDDQTKSLNGNKQVDVEAHGLVKKSIIRKLLSKLCCSKQKKDNSKVETERNLCCCFIFVCVLFFISLVVTSILESTVPKPLKKVECANVKQNDQIVAKDDRFAELSKKLEQQMDMVVGKIHEQTSILAERLEKSEANARKLSEQVAELTKQSKDLQLQVLRTVHTQQPTPVVQVEQKEVEVKTTPEITPSPKVVLADEVKPKVATKNELNRSAVCSSFCSFLKSTGDFFYGAFYYTRYPFTLVFGQTTSDVIMFCLGLTLTLLLLEMIHYFKHKGKKPFDKSSLKVGAVFSAIILVGYALVCLFAVIHSCIEGKPYPFN
ncbi:hypothetical protein M3Y95_00383300 [Aphelenchoides besseyi]|nr:hypothetical protein M3Y95_00383300 [Aphelenchoides besseyi]